MISAALDDFNAAALGFGQLSVAFEDLRIPQNPIERGAEFMAHIGEKRRFGAIRGFGGLFRLLEFDFRLFALGDLLLKLLILGVKLLARLAQTQVRPHPRQHLFGLKRLGDVIHPAHGEGFHFLVGLVQRADEQDRNLLRLGLGFEAAAHLIPVQAGHQDVEQNQSRPFALHEFQRGEAIFGKRDLIRLA